MTAENKLRNILIEYHHNTNLKTDEATKQLMAICQEAVDEINKAHREELLLLTDKYNAMRIKEIDEACREQKRICANLYAVETKDDQYYSILNAPTPKGDINEKAKH